MREAKATEQLEQGALGVGVSTSLFRFNFTLIEVFRRSRKRFAQGKTGGNDGICSLSAGMRRSLPGHIPRPEPARRLARSGESRRRKFIVVSGNRRGARLARAERGSEQRRGGGVTTGGPRGERSEKRRERERAKRRKEEKVSEGEFSSSSSSLLSARGNRKKTQPRPPSTTGKKKVPPRPRPPRTQDPSGRRNVQRCCLGETPVSFLQLKRKQERERRRVSSFIGSLMKKEKTHNPKRPFSKPGIPTTTTTATPARLSVGGCSSFC